VPLDWARTQARVADALELLGERDDGTAHCLRRLPVIAPVLRSFGMIACQSNGRCLSSGAARDPARMAAAGWDTERLQQSVAAYRAEPSRQLGYPKRGVLEQAPRNGIL
jgi:hypothetical protein